MSSETEDRSPARVFRYLATPADIRTFVVDNGAYYFIAVDGRRGDIIRCQTYQPGIGESEDYYFYMWVQSLQGYFMLRQRFEGGRAGDWQLLGEFETEESGSRVFDLLSDEVVAMLQSGELT